MPNKKYRFGINRKILTIVLGVSCLSLLIFLFISSLSMKKQQSYALQSSEKLGNEAAAKSMEALESLTEKYLEKLVASQAKTSNLIFQHYADQVADLATFTEEIYQNPGQIINDKKYSLTEQPTNIENNSVYKLAPGVQMADVKKELTALGGLDYYFRAVWRTKESDLRNLYIGTVSGIFKRWPYTSDIKKSYNFKERVWYKQALETKAPGWTLPYPGANSGLMMVTCFCPVFDKDKNIIAVTAADITITNLIKIISTNIGDIGYAFLLDKTGEVIAQVDENGLLARNGSVQYLPTELLLENNIELKKIARKMIQGITDVDRFVGDDGKERFLAYAPEPSTGWSIGVSVPVADAKVTQDLIQKTKGQINIFAKQAEVDISTFMFNMQQRVIIAFVLIVVIILIVAINFSHKITGPIALLAESTERIGQGELDIEIPEVKTKDEINGLSISFNQMLINLKSYITQLQETTAAKERIESELQLAHDIQSGMLPQEFPPFPDRDEFDIYAFMEPAREVGGDLYDFFFIDEDSLCFFVGDVSGKGVPASLFMMVAKTLLHSEAKREDVTAAHILKTVNKRLCQDNDQCLFVTAFIGLLNLKTGVLQYADAGHNAPLFYHKQAGKFEYMEKQKSCAMGIVEELDFQNQSLNFAVGDKIFVYSDGVTDAVDSEENMFSEERLQAKLNAKKDLDVTSLIKGIQQDIVEFSSGADAFDDITMLAVEFK